MHDMIFIHMILYFIYDFLYCLADNIKINSMQDAFSLVPFLLLML